MSNQNNQTQAGVESTVEFKSISNYKKNVNILNKLSYEDNQIYKDLTDYLKNFILGRDSDVKSNITAPIGRFYISDDKMDRVFDLLEKCHKSNIVLHFRELQLSDIEKKIGTGIMFDFDLLQKSDKNEINSVKFFDFVKRSLFIINKVVNTDKLTTNYVGIIAKQKLVYKEDKKLYKNGFHMLIPCIKLTRQAKKIVLNEMLNDELLNTIFENTFNNKLVDAFDIGSISVPVYYLHNCKEESTDPYKLIHVYNIENSYDGHQITHINGDSFMDSCNSVKEFSLNVNGSLLKKVFCDLREPYHSRMMSSYSTQNKKEIEKEEAMSAFDKYNSYVDDNLDYYKKIVLDILDAKRADDRNLWRNVIFAIANISFNLRPAFKELAKLFSMRSESKYDNIEFERMWETATNNRGDSKITINSLIFWAKEDNAEAYKKLLHKDIKTTIELDVFARDNKVLTGQLYQYHFAYYIYHLFKQKFIYDIGETEKDGNWYEFVLDSDSHKEGEIYKWRLERKPDNLLLFISNRLPIIISDIIDKAENRIKLEEDENTITYISNRMNKLRTSAQGLYKTEFKNGILKEAETLFRSRGFSDRLDNCDNVMGLANGVLELGKNPKLLTGYHNYPISLFSEVSYIPYNKHNPHVKKLLGVLISLFPDNEIDIFHYLMYYLCTSLDAKAKNSEILILTGNGCHSIDTPIKMFNGTIKKVQDIILGDKLMGDDNAPRVVQELFRGKDTMVRISPIKEKSFIVNINHILSLKFTNLIIIDKLDITWYEKNGIYQPIKKIKTLFCKKDLQEFKIRLLKDINVINENDIIDIKVKDLIKWESFWLKQEKLNLYKNASLDAFSIEILEEDNYYGFELDKNHRYVTGDGFVHHNSNGKSTLAELIKSVLGKYAAKVNMSVLTEQRNNSAGANEQMMVYKKARLAFYSETNKAEKLNCAMAKELTSQESITGRGIFEKQSSFRPMCNHLITTNYPFTVNTTDHGIWRRLKTYELKNKFCLNPDPENIYEKMADMTIAKEFAFNKEIKEAFLSILVEYYRDLYNNHNGELSNIDCPTIIRESALYRNQQDTLNRFICEYVIYSTSSEVCSSELADKYETWLLKNIGKNSVPERVEVNSQIMNSILIKYVKRTNTKIIFKGIRLLDDMLQQDILANDEIFLKEKLGLGDVEDMRNNYDLSRFNPLNL